MSKIREKSVSRMWENVYLSIKKPKAFRALKFALHPGHRCSLRLRDSTSLRRQLSASEAASPFDQILDPHLKRLLCFEKMSLHCVSEERFVCRAKLSVFQTCFSSLVNQRRPRRTVTNNMKQFDAQIMIGEISSNHNNRIVRGQLGQTLWEATVGSFLPNKGNVMCAIYSKMYVNNR